MRLFITLSVLLLLALGTAACGYKGPLVPADPQPPARQQESG